MSRTYQTKAGDVLDEIVARVYGRTSGIVEEVLEVNRSLALSSLGPILPGGLTLSLPEIPEPEQETRKLVRLWE